MPFVCPSKRKRNCKHDDACNRRVEGKEINTQKTSARSDAPAARASLAPHLLLRGRSRRAAAGYSRLVVKEIRSVCNTSFLTNLAEPSPPLPAAAARDELAPETSGGYLFVVRR